GGRRRDGGGERPGRRRRRVRWQDVRGARATLSRHAYSDVPIPPPFPDAHVTRADLERLVMTPLTKAAELVVTTVRDAGRSPRDLAGVFLVGGSSRIPLVARLVHERTGILPTTLDQPETVVARGALRAVTPDPMRTGGLPRAAGPLPRRQQPPRQFATPPGPFAPAQVQRLQAPPRPQPAPANPNR